MKLPDLHGQNSTFLTFGNFGKLRCFISAEASNAPRCENWTMSCIGLGSSWPTLTCHHVCMDLAALASWSPSDRQKVGGLDIMRQVFLVDAVEHVPTASLKIHKVFDIDTLCCLSWNWCLWTMTFRFERNKRSRSQLPSDDYTSVASPWLCMSWSPLESLSHWLRFREGKKSSWRLSSKNWLAGISWSSTWLAKKTNRSGPPDTFPQDFGCESCRSRLFRTFCGVRLRSWRMVQGQSDCLGGEQFSSFTASRDFWAMGLSGRPGPCATAGWWRRCLPGTESLFGLFRSFKLKYAKALLSLLFKGRDLLKTNHYFYFFFPMI